MQRYAITNRTSFASAEVLPKHLGGWGGGGVEWVQVREKDLSQQALLELVSTLAALLPPRRADAKLRTKLLVNGLPAALAHACGANGVHLPGGASAEQVQAAVLVAGLVSVSCHTLPEVQAARAGGAAAVLWAPVFEKRLGDQQLKTGSGLPALHEACAAAQSVPVFALGGVTLENAGTCIAAGACGVAGIRLFAGEDWRRLDCRSRSDTAGSLG